MLTLTCTINNLPIWQNKFQLTCNKNVVEENMESVEWEEKIESVVSANRTLHTDFLLSRVKSWKLCPGERVLPGEDRPVLALEPGEQPSTL